ncbi:MAG: hypothetical protein A3K76_05020 [Euryarchaeota archaeon RBG_13_57_23]|nr:MAG: hypothetical protein A3K76_05020 [Euryarchaeota archaeon RBG_13_57_23]
MPNYRVRFSQSPDSPIVRAKLFGIGSAGCNIIEGAPFPAVAISSSAADLARSHAERKVLVGQDRLIGISDADPDIMIRLPSIVGHELPDMFNNTEVAFMMCGLGGTSGSLGAKMLSSIARVKGTTGIVLAATPFSAESIRRREVASRALHEILSISSLCVEFDNDKLSSLGSNIPLSRAFGLLNGIMMRPVIDLSATMTRDDVPGFRQGIGDSTYARFGLGLGRGDERVERVVHEAVTSPWFDFPLINAAAAIAIFSSADPWDKEISEVLSRLEGVMPSAKLFWGAYSDASLADRIRLSLLVCTKA